MSLANKTAAWVEKQIITPEQRKIVLCFYLPETLLNKFLISSGLIISVFI